MLTTLVAAIAFLFGTFFERILFAVFILIFARMTIRALRRLRKRMIAAAAPIVLRATMLWANVKRRARFAFGPTIRVVA